MNSVGDIPKRLVIGMSHTNALAAAAKPEDAITILNLNDHPDIFDKRSRRLKVHKIPKGDADEICLSMGGNMHNILGLLNHPVPFSVGAALLPDDPQSEGRIVIPEPAMRAVMAKRIEFLFDLTGQIHAHFAGIPFMHITPPPPVPNLDAARKTTNILKDKLHLGLSPNPIRKALYDMQCELYAEQTELHKARPLPCPPEAISVDGFLAEGYFGDDPTHGNTKYGRSVLDALNQIGRAT